MSCMKLGGAYVAIITPMKDDSQCIDFKSFEDLIRFQIDNQIKGIVVGGTTGEGSTLESTEFTQLIAVAVRLCRHRNIQVIAGTGSNSTKATVEKTKLAQECGADAALVVVPYYNKPTQEGLYQHYTHVANAVFPFPLILYNVPGRTSCDLSADTTARLSLIPNIIGIKEACGDLQRFVELSEKCEQNFSILSGEDALTIPAMTNTKTRVTGVISVTANILPRLIQKNCELALHQKMDEALQLDQKLQPLHKILFIQTNPLPIKWLVNSVYRFGGGIRLPLVKLDDHIGQKVLECYKQVVDLATV